MSGSASASAARFRTLRNVLTNWGAFGLNAFIGFLLSPYVVRSLGEGLYGVWVLVGSLVGYMGLLDAGVRGAVTKYVATHHAAHRHEDAQRIASAALAFFGGAGIVAIAGSAVIGYGVLPHLGVPESLRSTLPAVVLLCGVAVAVTLVTGVFGGVIVGVQRFDRQNAITMGVGVLRALGTVAALEAGTGLLGIAWVQLAAALVQGSAIVATSRWLYPELRIRPRGWEPAHLRLLLTFGLASTLLSASGVVIDYSDSFVIGSFLSVAAITPFAIAANLVLYARAVVSGISHIVTPLMGSLEGSGALERCGETTLRYARYATLVLSPVVVTFVLRGGPFIGLWMEPRYEADGGAVLFVLSLSLWTFAGFQVLTASLMGLNRHRGLIPVFLLEAVLNLALSIFLAREVGLLGVAWGTTIPRLSVCLLIGPFFAQRQLGLSVAAYWRDTVLRPVAAMLPFAALSFWVEMRWPAGSLVVFFAQVAAALPVAVLGAAVLGLDASERAQARATLHRALGLRPPTAGATPVEPTRRSLS